jgi:hypothetical protein
MIMDTRNKISQLPIISIKMVLDQRTLKMTTMQYCTKGELNVEMDTRANAHIAQATTLEDSHYL